MLKDYFDAAQSLVEQRIQIFKKFSPILIENTSSVIWEITDLLGLALSSCVVLKSARVEVQQKKPWGELTYVLTQKSRGLKEKWSKSPYAVLNFLGPEYEVSFGSDKVLKRRYFLNSSFETLDFKQLINHSQIDQDRLKKFFEFLQESVELFQELLNDPYFTQATSEYQLEKKYVKLNTRALKVFWSKNEIWLAKYDSEWSAPRVISFFELIFNPIRLGNSVLYSLKQSFSKKKTHDLDSVLVDKWLTDIFIEHEKIEDSLLEIGKRKKYFHTCFEELKKKLLDFTKSFRFLQKLEE